MHTNYGLTAALMIGLTVSLWTLGISFVAKSSQDTEAAAADAQPASDDDTAPANEAAETEKAPIADSLLEKYLPAPVEALEAKGSLAGAPAAPFRAVAFRKKARSSEKDRSPRAPEPETGFTDDNPKEVEGHIALVTAQVAERDLAERDWWLGVIPVLAPDTLYLQATKIASPRPTMLAVYVGLKDVRMAEPFQILVVSCPKGAIDRRGPIAVDELQELDLQIVDSIVVQRTR